MSHPIWDGAENQDEENGNDQPKSFFMCIHLWVPYPEFLMGMSALSRDCPAGGADSICDFLKIVWNVKKRKIGFVLLYFERCSKVRVEDRSKGIDRRDGGIKQVGLSFGKIVDIQDGGALPQARFYFFVALESLCSWKSLW
jgi:hypothetical protein